MYFSDFWKVIAMDVSEELHDLLWLPGSDHREIRDKLRAHTFESGLSDAARKHHDAILLYRRTYGNDQWGRLCLWARSIFRTDCAGRVEEFVWRVIFKDISDSGASAPTSLRSVADALCAYDDRIRALIKASFDVGASPLSAWDRDALSGPDAGYLVDKLSECIGANAFVNAWFHIVDSKLSFDDFEILYAIGKRFAKLKGMDDEVVCYPGDFLLYMDPHFEANYRSPLSKGA